MFLSWFKSKSSPKHSRAGAPLEQTADVAALLEQAIAQHNEGRLDEATALCLRIVRHAPKHSDAIHLLGVVALQQEKFAEAQEYFQRALLMAPDNIEGLTNLSRAMCARGHFAAAAEPLKKALALDPHSAQLTALLGATLLQADDIAGARAAWVQTTHLAPQDPVAHNRLGEFLSHTDDLEAAATAFEQAVKLDPTFDAALENLANVQFRRGNVEASVDAYRRLVSHSTAGASVHHAFGNALMAAGDASSAQQHYKRAIKLEPERANARWALAMAHIRPLYDGVQDMQASRRAFAKAIEELDAWFTPARMVLGPKAVGSTQPFYLAYHAQSNLELLRHYGRLCCRLMQAGSQEQPVLVPKPLQGRKLRIGVASAQVRNHSVWNAVTKGWVEHLDPTQFEVHVFHLGRSSDEETALARREATDFVDTPRSLEAWSQAIRDAELDVLIYPEIGMDTLTTQLAAQRLAPVQAASWGHPHTTGLPTLDLFISAELLEPPQGDAHYSEKLVRLPHLGVCLTPLQPLASTPDLVALGLPNDEPLLLCPGLLFKYRGEHDAVWAALGKRLQERGSGRLVFFLSHAGAMAQQFEKRMRTAFKQAGVNFDKTVCLIPTLQRDQFYGLMQRATLMLDTIGFSGFNTALQALECGLPVVAHEGEFMRGRLASALLRHIGLVEWVATSDAEFVDKAMRLVQDVVLRQELRESIAQRRALLFNDKEPVRALEQVLRDAVAAKLG